MPTVTGICIQCNEIGELPALDDMVSDTCEICTMDSEEVRQKYGRTTALFKDFREELEEFRKRITLDVAKRLIIQEATYCFGNFMLNTIKGGNRVTVTLLYHFKNRYIPIFEFGSSMNQSRSRITDRVVKKLKAYQPQIAVKYLLKAFNDVHEGAQHNAETYHELLRNRDYAVDAVVKMPWYMRLNKLNIIKAIYNAWDRNEEDGLSDGSSHEHS